MTTPCPLLSKHPSFEALLETSFPEDLRTLTRQFWRTPDDLQNTIWGMLADEFDTRNIEGIVVSGETTSTSVYIWDREGMLVLMPQSSVQENIVLQELYDSRSLPLQTSFCLFRRDPTLLRRLRLPKVLLVNPCVLENFPVPRLSLSVGLVAGYLRRFQRAEVRIIDMQMYMGVGDVVTEAKRFLPDLVGLSISYGQKQVGLQILDQLEELRAQRICNPLFVLGNIIPASFPREFLERHERLVVSMSEGELTAVGLARYLVGELPLDQVPGLAYRNEDGSLCITPSTPVPMESIPLPALDTVGDLARYKGALTLEISRGCQWNRCTFCPREHKSKQWKTFSTSKIIEQFAYLSSICSQFGLRPHVFLADEEFVGGLNDRAETQRLSDLALSLITANLGLKFDAAARADQIYNPKEDRQWHTDRLRMWHLCRKAGLDRLFMGIESGSNAQLKRYGKGLTAQTSIFAMRLLSALGIPLRFGFITFDPLMVGLEDLKENIAFLERTDAFVTPLKVEHYGYDRLLELLTKDEEFVHQHASGKPIFASVSYMLASLEVLINSPYAQMMRVAEDQLGAKLIDDNALDTNMGRYSIEFLDPLIRDISVSCQKWIDRNFALAYTVKSLYKVALPSEQKLLMDWMVGYRCLSLQLLKAIIYLFDTEPLPIAALGFPSSVTSVAEGLRRWAANPEQERVPVIEECLVAFERLVEELNASLELALEQGALTDNKEKSLLNVLSRWKDRAGCWKLINDPALSRWAEV